MDSKQALGQAREIFEAGEVEINGRVYAFTKVRHEKRVEVFALFSSVGSQLSVGDFSCITTPNFKHVQKIMFDAITFDGDLLSRLPNHFEDYPEDYIELIGTSMGVMSYPFLRGGITGSQSQNAQAQKTISRKPI